MWTVRRPAEKGRQGVHHPQPPERPLKLQSRGFRCPRSSAAGSALKPIKCSDRPIVSRPAPRRRHLRRFRAAAADPCPAVRPMSTSTRRNCSKIAPSPEGKVNLNTLVSLGNHFHFLKQSSPPGGTYVTDLEASAFLRIRQGRFRVFFRLST